VEEELRKELCGAVFVDTPNFLEELFNVPTNVIDNIYEKACKGKNPYYTQSKWRDIPTSMKAENKLYLPFVKVANFITAKCPKHRLDVRWLSDPNRDPVLADKSAAEMKPDIVSVLGFPMDAEQRGDKAPWRRIHTPMEVKKSDASLAAALQLFKYQRQVFHESIDRRFVFGIVLAQRNVSVYLADRSGVLGSEVFDMHEVSTTCL
jgi:hypothetical protein